MALRNQKQSGVLSEDKLMIYELSTTIEMEPVQPGYNQMMRAAGFVWFGGRYIPVEEYQKIIHRVAQECVDKTNDALGEEHFTLEAQQ